MTNIATVLRRARIRNPSREAVREWESGRSISYGELDESCTALALYFQQAGLKPGERVGIYLPNVIEFIISQFGVLRAGLVATYINYRLSIQEAMRQLHLADARTVITTKERAEAFCSTQEMRGVNFIVADTEGPFSGGLLLSSILSSARPDGITIEPSPCNDALLRFTSGSTGYPKGAIVTHRAWVTRALQLLAEVVRLEEESMVLCPGPLTHAAGLFVLPTFLRSGSLLLMSKFDTTQIGKITESLPVKYGMFVPTMIKMILEDRQTVEKVRKSRMKQINYGGSPIAQQVLENALEQLTPIAFVQTYGSHEAGSMSFLDEFDHKSPRLLESAGKPLLNVEFRIEPVESHEFGQLMVRTPWSANALLTEHGKKETTGAWVRTGDLGEMRDGYLFLMDRLNDVIVSGSFNVFPGEVERCIVKYPGISECVIVGVPDDKWGEQVVAYLVKKPGADVSDDELKNYCRQSLAGYKVPKAFNWVDEIPLNAARKPDRRLLAASKWQGHGRRIH
jgi:acyl-CoA synthetase (AMP-forming)/AMP-acid ligase II